MRLIAALFALLLLVPAGAHAQTFPELTGRVVDAANLLSPEQEAQLGQLSDAIETASTRQFVIATIPDLQDYPIEDYGYRLGRAWGIGQSEANNGIILIVAPKERKVRIEVGYGLEPIMTDALSNQIIQEQILPRFRDGDMPGGIIAGAQAIGEQMKLPLEAAEARAAAQTARPAKRGKGAKVAGIAAVVGLFWLLIVVAAIIGVARRGRGRRYRRGGIGVGEILLWSALDHAARRSSWGGGSSWRGGGSSWGGGGFGGFSGGGGSFGGGGASGSW